jgi:hypothetical protein
MQYFEIGFIPDTTDFLQILQFPPVATLERENFLFMFVLAVSSEVIFQIRL